VPSGGGLPDHLFRHLVDRTAVPFVLIDRAGVIHYASRSTTRLVGLSPEEGVGRNILEFLDAEDVDLALSGLSEVQTHEQVDAGIPVVFPIRRPDGARMWLEVAVRPIFEVPELGLTSLRLRSWDAEHHLADFMEGLLADAPLPTVLATLTRSVAASVQGLAAAVHHGWDGERFVGVAGSWPDASKLALDEGPWVGALGQPGVLQLASEAVAGAPAARSHCLIAVGGEKLPPAVLSVWTDVPGRPMLGHRRALSDAGRYVELAIVRTSEHQRLLHLAGHDSLTGVANRAAFRDHLAHALAIGESGFAVGFCDLDGFKQLNDRYGHVAGDDVLVQVAARLRAALRDTDELARVGGDEFTILWRGIDSHDEADHVGGRLLSMIEEPFAVPGGHEPLGISVGIALAGPGATADGLLRAADAALYQSKRAGGRLCTITG